MRHSDSGAPGLLETGLTLSARSVGLLDSRASAWGSGRVCISVAKQNGDRNQAQAPTP